MVNFNVFKCPNILFYSYGQLQESNIQIILNIDRFMTQRGPRYSSGRIRLKLSPAALHIISVLNFRSQGSFGILISQETEHVGIATVQASGERLIIKLASESQSEVSALEVTKSDSQPCGFTLPHSLIQFMQGDCDFRFALATVAPPKVCVCVCVCAFVCV